jgi:DNA-binding NarL/FixJ family response regulator
VIRLVIADDHTIVREGLKQVLAAAAGISVIGEAKDGHEVLARVRSSDFDLLLLDMSMPGKSGIELIKQVRAEKPKLRILVLTMHEEPQYAVRAIKAGAAGYLTKDSASALLLTAIRKVASGGAFINADVAEQLALGAMPQFDGPPHQALSDREFQVFQLIVAGQSLTEIGAALNLSVKTISTHKSHVMEKLGITNQTGLIQYAISHKLISLPDTPA